MKYSRAQVVQELQMRLGAAQTVNIEELPQQLRHACAPAGVTFLPQQAFPVPVFERDYMTKLDMQVGEIPFYYYYCPYCAKLFASKSLYD